MAILAAELGLRGEAWWEALGVGEPDTCFPT